MRVVIAHVAYRERGGEDAVVERDADALRARGVDVRVFTLDSLEFDALSALERLRLIGQYPNHALGARRMGEFLSESADVVHFHNIHPMLGTGAIHAARASGAATVMSLHNYRVDCVAGTHFLGNAICERCSVHNRFPGVVRACYRGSRVQSLVMSRGSAGLWETLGTGALDAIVCLDDYVKMRLVSAGLPEETVFVVPNGSPRGESMPYAERRGAVFVGRLVPEKGVLGLVRAWNIDTPLTIVGGGPLLQEVRSAAASRNISVVGGVAPEAVSAALASSRVAVASSVWYEVCPMAVQEALAVGTPVVGFDVGVMPTYRDPVTPNLVRLGAFSELVRTADALACMSKPDWSAASERAQCLHAERFDADRHADSLLRLYGHAVDRRRND